MRTVLWLCEEEQKINILELLINSISIRYHISIAYLRSQWHLSRFYYHLRYNYINIVESIANYRYYPFIFQLFWISVKEISFRWKRCAILTLSESHIFYFKLNLYFFANFISFIFGRILICFLIKHSKYIRGVIVFCEINTIVFQCILMKSQYCPSQSFIFT